MARAHARLRRILARRVAEQDGRCCYCRRRFTAAGATEPTLEHRKAKMDGGTDAAANLAAACRQCNAQRGAQMNRARQQARARRQSAPAEAAPD